MAPAFAKEARGDKKLVAERLLAARGGFYGRWNRFTSRR